MYIKVTHSVMWILICFLYVHKMRSLIPWIFLICTYFMICVHKSHSFREYVILHKTHSFSDVNTWYVHKSHSFRDVKRFWYVHKRRSFREVNTFLMLHKGHVSLLYVHKSHSVMMWIRFLYVPKNSLIPWCG